MVNDRTVALANVDCSSTKIKDAKVQTSEQISANSSSSEAASITPVDTPPLTKQGSPSPASVGSSGQSSGRCLLASIWPEACSQTNDENIRPECSNLTVYSSLSSFLPALKDAKASEVRWIMQHLAFRPKEAAFTTMFKACGSDVAKAFELWKAMKARPDVKPNNISYSVMIRICGDGGDCVLAGNIFKEHLIAAGIAGKSFKRQPSPYICRSFIAALLKNKQILRAIQWTKWMFVCGIYYEPQLYNDVLMAALRAEVSMLDIAVLFATLHDAKMSASSEAYNLVLLQIEQQYGWRIVQHFVEIASYAGAQFSRETCVIIMDIYCRAGAVQSSEYLLKWFLQEDFHPHHKKTMAYAALHNHTQTGDFEGAVHMWESFFVPRGLATRESARLVLDSFRKAGNTVRPHPYLERDLLHAYTYGSKY